jgi:hypothetical protein
MKVIWLDKWHYRQSVVTDEPDKVPQHSEAFGQGVAVNLNRPRVIKQNRNHR